MVHVPSVASAEDEGPPATITDSAGITLRLLPAGRFRMGSDLGKNALELSFPKSTRYTQVGGADETPRHAVRLTRSFYIGTTEVTVAQFRRFVEATGYKTSAEASGEGATGFSMRRTRLRPFERKPDFTWRAPGFEQGDDHPVACVSWEDARAFCEWLSDREGKRYDLPTEAEWEYACRAGSETWFSFGDEARGVVHERCNTANVELEKAHPGLVLRQWLVDVEKEPGDGHVYTAPVASYPANPWELHDLHGNVWEWCRERYLDTYYKRFDEVEAVDPCNDEPMSGVADLRVIRGGSWYNAPIFCRAAMRGFYDATDAAAYIGFRVVREE